MKLLTRLRLRLGRLAWQARLSGTASVPVARHCEPSALCPRQPVPVSRCWGYDRGLPMDRYYIESFLARNAGDVRGRVLEIGNDFYTRRFGSERVTRRDVLHVLPGNLQATIVADLARADHIPSDAFDCLIVTQTLQYVYDLPACLRTLHRILKPGGVVLATCPGISRACPEDWGGTFFWRFTSAAVGRLFAEVFSEPNVRVEGHGNVLIASAFLYGFAVEELESAELAHHDPDYEISITVRAVKAGT